MAMRPLSVEEKFEKLSSIQDRLQYIESRQKISSTEKLSVTAMAWWAILLILPFDTFSTSESFRIMSKMAPEWLWSVMVGLISAQYLLILWITQKRTINIKIYRCCVLISIFWWALLSFMLLWSNPQSPAWGIYAIFMVSQSITFARTFDCD